MMRVRTDGALLWRPPRCAPSARSSSTYARDTADITDRENIQYHWIRIEDVPAIWERLDAVGLDHPGGVRRLARGRSSAPRSPASPPTRSSTARRRSTRSSARYIGNPEFSNLPRKFKTAVTGHPSHDVAPEVNDVSFVGTVHPEHGPGFDLWVGGGLSTNPMLAQKLGVWIPLDEVADVWEGVASIFRDYGYRRLRIAGPAEVPGRRLGRGEVPRGARERVPRPAAGLAATPPPRRRRTATTSACTTRRTAGSTSASPPSPAASTGTTLVAARRPGGQVRRRRRPAHAVPEARGPRRRPTQTSTRWSPTSTRSGSAPGRRTGGATRWPAPASSSASSPSSTPSSAPATWSPSWSSGSPTSTRPITVNVNGCPNACARTQVADIGLKGQLVLDADGQQVEGFQVHLGGALGLEANFGRKLRAHKVTSAGLDDYVTIVVTTSWPTARRRVVRDLGRARRRGPAARREDARGGAHERARVPFHCPYCGEEDLWPHEVDRTAPGSAAAACARSP